MEKLFRSKFTEEYKIGLLDNNYFDNCHDHEHYEFVFAVKGEGINFINDTVQLLLSGMLVLIRPSDTHAIRKIDNFDGDFRGFNIEVEQDFMENEFALNSALRDFALNTEVPIRVKLHAVELESLYMKAMSLYEMKPSDMRTYLCHKLIQEMCYYLLTNASVSNDVPQRWFLDLLAEIEKVNVQELTFEKMVSMSCMSRTALWQAFKKYMSISPTEYIKSKRANYAYSVIVNTDKSFLDIAMEIGYGSYAQFFRDIKTVYGITPKEIRANSTKKKSHPK